VTTIRHCHERKSRRQPNRKTAAYYAFDLLWRDGDLRKLPQIERKQMLSDLLGENDIGLPIIYSEHLTGDGQEMFEHAAKLNFEGIVSKRADAPYRSERTEAWLKIKTVQKGKFPVIGFVKDPTGVAALYLGAHFGDGERGFHSMVSARFV
jgi:bifunctional non-homologous end joining protein LigD